MIRLERKKLLVLSAAGGLVAAATGAMFIDGAASVQAFAVDAAKVFGDRSPGKRDKGALSNKKPFAAVAAERDPAPRKPKPAVAAVAPPPVATAEPPAAAVLPVAAAAPVAAVPAAAAAVPGGGLPFIPPIFPIPGGGGGGGITVTQVPPVTPPVTPPPGPSVPEPSTWLMMISGFGVLGLALRYRRRRFAVTARFGPALEPALARTA